MCVYVCVYVSDSHCAFVSMYVYLWVFICMYVCMYVYIYTQYSILVFSLDLTGKLGESGSNLDLGGVNLDLSDPYLTS